MLDRLRTARERLQAAGWPILQTAVAAGIAWSVSTALLGYEQPFYAAVAAVICLGITTGQRPRRALELVLGIAVGIAVADLLVLVIGTGGAQLVLVTALAMTVALLVGGSPLLVTQAGVAAILVVTIQPPTEGITLDRFVQGLVGGGTALLIGQVLFPLDPLTRVLRIARPVFTELATVLHALADALADADLDGARQALNAARALDPGVRGLTDALGVGLETARFAPVRRSARGRLATQADIARQVDLAVRNTRVLARAAVALLSHGAQVPPELPAAVADLAAAVEALSDCFEHPDRAEVARKLAVAAADRAAAVLSDRGELWVPMVVGQIRSTALDLLRGSGLDLTTAITTLDRDLD